MVSLGLCSATSATAMVPGMNTPNDLAPEYESRFGEVAGESGAPMLRWQGISADSAKAKARVAAAQANGQQVLVHLLQTPNWEGDGPSDAEIDQYVRRLRINIPKWAAMGVHHFEVWNEPDHKTFWGGTPDPARYTRMLKLAYPVIKAADPESVVISAGLTNHNDAYLAAMYRAGAKGSMDAVGTHMYSRYRPEDCDRRYKRRYLCNIADMRRVMIENGDTKKRIWMTEFGWWACPGASNCVSHGAQAAFVTRGYAFLERYPYLEGAFWFSDYDYAATSRLYGLRTRDLMPRPGFARFQTVAAAYAAQE